MQQYAWNQNKQRPKYCADKCENTQFAQKYYQSNSHDSDSDCGGLSVHEGSPTSYHSLNVALKLLRDIFFFSLMEVKGKNQFADANISLI